ncbi:MAG: hypothetical protein GX491_21555 [Chloroflexi bacterium]|jgi:hypothetical protein|nr:hypothetical protein [Chloroflexota bacterium]
MILLNFSHPITPEQRAQAEALLDRPLDRVVELPVHFDGEQPFLPQLGELMARLPLSPAELQAEPLIVNLPSLNFIAGLLLAELHGRMGYFPPILRLRPVSDSLPPRYEVAEILNLQAVRDAARAARYR